MPGKTVPAKNNSSLDLGGGGDKSPPQKAAP